MKKEEISEAMKDIKFAESIMDMQSPEEIKKAFKAKGVDLSLEESKVVISTIKKIDESESGELSEDDLQKIVGGVGEGEKSRDPKIEKMAIIATGVAVGMFAYATFSNAKNLVFSAGGKIVDAIIRKIKK